MSEYIMFNIGDVVFIKSETKEMTIYDLTCSGSGIGFNIDTAKCVWLDKNDQLWERNFPLLILEKKLGKGI